jgi:lipopolysaccharide biosynthesis regulator YciM
MNRAAHNLTLLTLNHSRCEVDYAIRVNATSMMSVRAGFNDKAEMEAGLFSIQVNLLSGSKV